MTFNKKGKHYEPLAVFPVNGKYILGVYKGSFSEFDLLIRYRQLEKQKWSSLRTPSHVHWVVDVLIKWHMEPKKTAEFLDFLLHLWGNTLPVKSREEQIAALTVDNLVELHRDKISEYEELGKKGEYSITFLILLAKLLMIQEKSNRADAYMFKKVLDHLKSGTNIYRAISTAQHRGARK